MQIVSVWFHTWRVVEESQIWPCIQIGFQPHLADENKTWTYCISALSTNAVAWLLFCKSAVEHWSYLTTLQSVDLTVINVGLYWCVIEAVAEHSERSYFILIHLNCFYPTRKSFYFLRTVNRSVWGRSHSVACRFISSEKVHVEDEPDPRPTVFEAATVVRTLGRSLCVTAVANDHMLRCVSFSRKRPQSNPMCRLCRHARKCIFCIWINEYCFCCQVDPRNHWTTKKFSSSTVSWSCCVIWNNCSSFKCHANVFVNVLASSVTLNGEKHVLLALDSQSECLEHTLADLCCLCTGCECNTLCVAVMAIQHPTAIPITCQAPTSLKHLASNTREVCHWKQQMKRKIDNRRAKPNKPWTEVRLFGMCVRCN